MGEKLPPCLRVCSIRPSRTIVYVVSGLEEKKNLNIALVLYFMMKEEISNKRTRTVNPVGFSLFFPDWKKKILEGQTPTQ